MSALDPTLFRGDRTLVLARDVWTQTQHSVRAVFAARGRAVFAALIFSSFLAACHVSRVGEGVDDMPRPDGGVSSATIAGGRERPVGGWRIPVRDEPDVAEPPGSPTVATSSSAGAANVEDASASARVTDAGSTVDASSSSTRGSRAADANVSADAHAAASDSRTASKDAAVAADVLSCGGASALGMCWYLASAGTPCSAHCAKRGGFDERSVALTGTALQGGSLESCEAVFAALKLRGMVHAATRIDGVGLGCHRWSDGELFWVESPDTAFFSADSAAEPAEVTCACAR